MTVFRVINLAKRDGNYTHQALASALAEFNDAQPHIQVELVSYDLDNFVLEVVNNQLKLFYVTPKQVNTASAKRHAKPEYDYHKEPITPENTDLILARFGPLFNHNGLAVLEAAQALGINVTNTAGAISACRDKWSCYRRVAHLVPLVNSTFATWKSYQNLDPATLEFPRLAKPNTQSLGGQGIVLSYSQQQLVQNTQDLSVYDFVLTQDFVKAHEHVHFDLRVMVLNGQVTGSFIRVAAKDSAVSNIAAGGYGLSYAIDAQLAQQALAICQQLELDVAGLDFVWHPQQQQWQFLEANASPGFFAYDQVCQQPFAQHLLDYLLIRLTGYASEYFLSHGEKGYKARYSALGLSLDEHPVKKPLQQQASELKHQTKQALTAQVDAEVDSISLEATPQNRHLGQGTAAEQPSQTRDLGLANDLGLTNDAQATAHLQVKTDFIAPELSGLTLAQATQSSFKALAHKALTQKQQLELNYQTVGTSSKTTLAEVTALPHPTSTSKSATGTISTKYLDLVQHSQVPFTHEGADFQPASQVLGQPLNLEAPAPKQALVFAELENPKQIDNSPTATQAQFGNPQLTSVLQDELAWLSNPSPSHPAAQTQPQNSEFTLGTNKPSLSSALSNLEYPDLFSTRETSLTENISQQTKAQQLALHLTRDTQSQASNQVIRPNPDKATYAPAAVLANLAEDLATAITAFSNTSSASAVGAGSANGLGNDFGHGLKNEAKLRLDYQLDLGAPTTRQQAQAIGLKRQELAELELRKDIIAETCAIIESHLKIDTAALKQILTDELALLTSDELRQYFHSEEFAQLLFSVIKRALEEQAQQTELAKERLNQERLALQEKILATDALDAEDLEAQQAEFAKAIAEARSREEQQHEFALEQLRSKLFGFPMPEVTTPASDHLPTAAETAAEQVAALTANPLKDLVTAKVKDPGGSLLRASETGEAKTTEKLAENLDEKLSEKLSENKPTQANTQTTPALAPSLTPSLDASTSELARQKLQGHKLDQVNQAATQSSNTQLPTVRAVATPALTELAPPAEPKPKSCSPLASLLGSTDKKLPKADLALAAPPTTPNAQDAASEAANAAAGLKLPAPNAAKLRRRALRSHASFYGKSFAQLEQDRIVSQLSGGNQQLLFNLDAEVLQSLQERQEKKRLLEELTKNSSELLEKGKQAIKAIKSISVRSDAPLLTTRLDAAQTTPLTKSKTALSALTGASVDFSSLPAGLVEQAQETGLKASILAKLKSRRKQEVLPSIFRPSAMLAPDFLERHGFLLDDSGFYSVNEGIFIECDGEVFVGSNTQSDTQAGQVYGCLPGEICAPPSAFAQADAFLDDNALEQALTTGASWLDDFDEGEGNDFTAIDPGQAQQKSSLLNTIKQLDPNRLVQASQVIISDQDGKTIRRIKPRTLPKIQALRPLDPEQLEHMRKTQLAFAAARQALNQISQTNALTALMYSSVDKYALADATFDFTLLTAPVRELIAPEHLAVLDQIERQRAAHLPSHDQVIGYRYFHTGNQRRTKVRTQNQTVDKLVHSGNLKKTFRSALGANLAAALQETNLAQQAVTQVADFNAHSLASGISDLNHAHPSTTPSKTTSTSIAEVIASSLPVKDVIAEVISGEKIEQSAEQAEPAVSVATKAGYNSFAEALQAALLEAQASLPLRQSSSQGERRFRFDPNLRSQRSARAQESAQDYKQRLARLTGERQAAEEFSQLLAQASNGFASSNDDPVALVLAATKFTN